VKICRHPIWRFLQRRLWSPECQLCGDLALGPDICRGCFRDLPRAVYSCRCCAVALPAPGVCGSCLNRPPPFERALVPFVYTFPVDRILQRLKYQSRLEHARLLGELLGHYVRQRSGPVDAIVPVPLHMSRWRQRGFNQALELARWASRVTGIPVARGLCQRVENTPPLWPLPPSGRRRLLKSAFKSERRTDGSRLVVLDDILTTGSTASAIATSLLKAGAATVTVWAVARSSGRQY
jgi:ComF family protein